MLGGAEEVGANCCYLNLGGLGVVIDSGLHPRRRDRLALPRLDLLAERPVDAFVLTHAHTDHVGGVPYMMKCFPHARMIATRPTRDLIEIMLRNTVKLLSSELTEEFPRDALSLYDHALVNKFSLVFESLNYGDPITLEHRAEQYSERYGERYGEGYGEQETQQHSLNGNAVLHPVSMSLHDAGHIIGSAGVLMKIDGVSILHTGDVQFGKQALLPGASLPRHHVDCLIMECTNGADEHPHTYKQEKERLAAFINEITNNGGSVLLPVFALGKTQEVIKVVSNLMNAGKIPRLPVYTGGMSKKISKVYDRYCYAVPRVEAGFELSTIPQQPLPYNDLLAAKYFKEPSIVIASSGMLNAGSPSFRLAERWMDIAHFGIGIMGYQDPSAPGYDLLHSERNKDFTMAGKTYNRKCHLEKFRFSAHASRETLLDYVFDVRPKHLFLVHGEPAAAESLGAVIKAHLPQTHIYLPTLGKSYKLDL
jgi:Cft2 family RNA processing exonuclease